jgi:hypothetical protein
LDVAAAKSRGDVSGTHDQEASASCGIRAAIQTLAAVRAMCSVNPPALELDSNPVLMDGDAVGNDLVN